MIYARAEVGNFMGGGIVKIWWNFAKNYRILYDSLKIFQIWLWEAVLQPWDIIIMIPTYLDIRVNYGYKKY